MQNTVNEPRNEGGSVTGVLPNVRKFLKTASPEQRPLDAVLRKQLSNYDRGDDESKAALKPMILESVQQLSDFQ